MAKFQVALAGEWKDYARDEDKILKRAFLAGYPNCKFTLRGATYEYNFRRMLQKNLTSGKERKIRAPHCWRQPSKPIVPKGPTISVRVPPGSPGTTIQVDHPHVKSVKINVVVPAHAKVGQAMLVPVPDVVVAKEVSVVAGIFASPVTTYPRKGKGTGKGKGKDGKPGPARASSSPGSAGSSSSPPAVDAAEETKVMPEGSSSDATAAAASAAAASSHALAPEQGPKKGSSGERSTSAKVAAGGLAAVGVGAFLGAHVALGGPEATGELLADGADDVGEWVEGAAEDVGDWAEDAFDWTVEAAEDAGEWIGDAAEDTGDFIVDLF